MTVREATPDDAASVRRVARASWHAAHDPILGEDAVEDVLDRYYDREGLAESIAREEAPMFLAVADGGTVREGREPSEGGEQRVDECRERVDDDGGERVDEGGERVDDGGERVDDDGRKRHEIVGFAQGGPSDDGPADAVVGRIYVHPDHWGEGHGTSLLKHLFDALRADGHDSVWLAVLADNEVGQSFYDARGFAVHEERTTEFVGHEVEDVVMVREL